jgi:FSR family fosmidomycin resistance protein-like MFS transporter
MTAMTAPAELSTERRSFAEVWFITIGHALTHWYPATFYVLTPLIGSELGLSNTQIASIVSVQAIAGTLANIPGGILVDTVSRKGLLMALSLAWVGIPYMIMSTAHAYWMLLACAALIGVGNTMWHPTAIPTLGRRFSERKGLVVSIHGMGGNIGDAIAPAVAGALVSGSIFSTFAFPAITWRQVMLFNVIPGILMAIAILWYLGRVQIESKAKAEKAPHITEVLKGFAGLLKNKTLMMLVVSSAFRSMTQGSLLVFLPLYLAKVMGYSLGTVGAAMMALQLCGFIAAPIAGGLSDKVGRRSIMMSSMAMTAVVLAFMIFAGGTEAFVFLVALLGFFLFAIRAVLQAWTLDATPKNMGGSAIGLLFGIQAIGTALGPLACGLIADRYGILSTFYFMAATIVFANMFVFFIPDLRKPATAKA